ncbi:EAL domain-containing protein [Arcobacter sp. FWKO B]|uniref:EAL domain-containing protein n=1 Tax=Arcobacter sp. FWKO B TaxID=2593672 RepID=UPI0018A590B7|nr:GGDEF and EAL domain-containing protein [Arcobacter sp. FWKO B]QOG13096.1 GGDEF and EAL domain-containing protein [Arcobacter sp. FWKO B]
MIDFFSKNKIFLAFIAILLFILASILHSFKVNEYIHYNKAFQEKVEKLKYCDEKLNVTILQGTILLDRGYSEIDDTMDRINNVYSSFETLNLTETKKFYLNEYLEIVKQKEQLGKDAVKAAINMQNVISQLPNMQFHLRENINFQDESEKQFLFQSSSILIRLLKTNDFKNSDIKYEIESLIQNLNNISLKNQQLNSFKNSYIELYNVYLNNQQVYIQSLNKVFELESKHSIELIDKEFLASSKNILGNLNSISILLVAIFTLTIISILFLLSKVKTDNKRLNSITKTLEFNSKYDSLTGLMNRTSFNEVIKSNPKDAVFILINIDNFKDLNDFYGFDVGDVILYKVANRLKLFVIEFFPQDTTIFRLGGDDFGILVNTRSKTFAFNSLILNFLNKISETNFNIKGFKIRITASASITKKEPYLQTADASMKVLKQKKNDKYIVYSDELKIFENSNKNFEYTHKVIQALEQNGIKPYFQPIVCAKTNKIIKYEALVRLIEPDGTVLTPNLFLDISKQIREYKYITQTMFLKSFNIFLERDEELSLNIGYEDMIDIDTETFIENQFIIFPELGPRITFEILETDSIEDYDKVYSFITKFKAYGCKFAIDDFGSGYSNFEQVLKMKADFLKIDGSLIKDVVKDPDAKIVVETIVDFAKKTGLKTIAEFVSDAEIAKILDEIGVDYKQGFYYGKPEPLSKTKDGLHE